MGLKTFTAIFLSPNNKEMASESGTLDSKEMKTRRMFEKYRTVDSGPDLGKKLDEAGILAAKRPGGAGGEER